jgi:hypothetical protein
MDSYYQKQIRSRFDNFYQTYYSVKETRALLIWGVMPQYEKEKIMRKFSFLTVGAAVSAIFLSTIGYSGVATKTDS